MQALNKKHRRKDSYVDKCHLLTLQSDFFLLTGNLKEKKKKVFLAMSQGPNFQNLKAVNI